MSLRFQTKEIYEQETNLNFLFLLNIDGSNTDTHVEIKGPVGSEIKKPSGQALQSKEKNLDSKLRVN